MAEFLYGQPFENEEQSTENDFEYFDPLLNGFADTNITLTDNIDKQIVESIQPWIQTLKETKLTSSQKMMIVMLETGLDQLVADHDEYADRIDLSVLSEKEYKVAKLLRRRKNSCKIAELLNISIRTVDAIRNRIHKKLQIESTSINL